MVGCSRVRDLLRDYGYTEDEIYGDPDYEYEEDIAGRLCTRCANPDGPYMSDRCNAYKMPLYMVSRKAKCKRFKEINYKLEPEDWW
ncbi:hypothetical protein LCGC14_0809820 [marine sediment metagenome]|uniref:Uncharacterized protein n=1 Tax=marine sediment metagenome TaxID=412755 RepID=A0A0F9PM43_9ZZZZ|nr:MAG: hypothetical protein Lokiarch_40150 [Candidatus Lokiarchaeum sp. GC14_75]